MKITKGYGGVRRIEMDYFFQTSFESKPHWEKNPPPQKYKIKKKLQSFQITVIIK